MKKYLLSVVICLTTCMFIYGNETAEYYKQRLAANGITLTDADKTYTNYQYSLLESFDFNAYRNYNTVRLVQIEDGPLIQLASLIQMQQLGKTVPASMLENKKDEVVSTNLKSVITLVNIGFRYGPKKHTETGF